MDLNKIVKEAIYEGYSENKEKWAGNKQGVCPYCDTSTLEYGNGEKFKDKYRVYVNCTNCGREGYERYGYIDTIFPGVQLK